MEESSDEGLPSSLGRRFAAVTGPSRLPNSKEQMPRAVLSEDYLICLVQSGSSVVVFSACGWRELSLPRLLLLEQCQDLVSGSCS